MSDALNRRVLLNTLHRLLGSSMDGFDPQAFNREIGDDMDDDLNRRATAVFRWAPGMLTTHRRRIYDTTDAYPLGIVEGDTRVRPDCAAIRHDSLIDTTDPATLGCMLAQVREAWKCPHIHVTPMWDLHGHQSAWGCYAFPADDEPIGKGKTEAEALVAAMEAAVARGASRG